MIMRQTQESNLRMLTQVLCYKWFPRREEHSLVSNFDNSDAMRKNWLRWCYNEGSVWTFLDFVRRPFLGGILPFLLDLTLAVAPRGLPKTQRWIPIFFTSPKPIQWSWWENISKKQIISSVERYQVIEWENIKHVTFRKNNVLVNTSFHIQA